MRNMHAFCSILAHTSLHDQAAFVTAVGLRQGGSDSRHAGRRCPGEGLCFAMCCTTSERLHGSDNRRGEDLVQQQHHCYEMLCSFQHFSTQLAADVSVSVGLHVIHGVHGAVWHVTCVCTLYLYGMFTICLHDVERICITLAAANTFHAHLVTLVCSS